MIGQLRIEVNLYFIDRKFFMHIVLTLGCYIFQELVKSFKVAESPGTHADTYFAFPEDT